MILFDLSFIRKDIHSGVAKYAYRILDYIVAYQQENNFLLLLNNCSKDFILNKYPHFEYIIIGNSIQSQIPVIRIMLLSFEYRKAVNKSGCKLVFCPWANFITFLPNKAKVVSVIHDVQHLIDLKGVRRVLYKLMYYMIVRNSLYIVTISEFAKSQILTYYPKVINRIKNLGNSVSMAEEILPNRLINSKYILYVGRICKMKNVITLVKSFALLNNKFSQYKLVLVGGKNQYYKNEIEPVITEFGLQERVIVESEISEVQLSTLYRDASLFVFPSLREGFGFPPIEAAYMLTPVISTKCDSLEEVTKNLLYYYNNPMDSVELSKKIEEVLSNYPSVDNLQKIKEEFFKSYSIDIVGKQIVDYLYKVENQIDNNG